MPIQTIQKLVKNMSFVGGSSPMKQLAVASAKALGLDASDVSLGKYEREYPGATFVLGTTRYWVYQQSARLKVVAVGSGTTLVYDGQMPEVTEAEAEAEASTSSSSTKKKKKK